MLPLYNNLLILVKLSSIMLSLSQITMISYDSVFHSFHSACFGINAGVQQLAMKQIQEYENYVGFIDSIVKIISSGESIQYEIRLLASISLKNIVGSRWISRRANMQTVNESEKQLLRSFSIQYYGESDKRISLQLAILASKIARHDWPNSWPDLFPELLQIIHANQSNLPHQKQALIITYEIIRELHEKKMPNVRQGLLIASPLVFSSIVPLWGACIDAIITNPTYISPQLITSIGSYDLEILLEHLYILTKILRCLIEESYEIISVQIDMNSFFPSFVSSMQRLVEYVLAYYNSLTNDGKLLYHDREPDINDDIFAFSTLAASLNSCHNSSSSNTFRTTATSDHNSTTTTNSTTNFTSSVAPSSGNRFVLIIIPMLKRLVYEMSLIPVRIQKENPIEFIPFLAPFLDFFSRQLMLQYQSDPSSGVLNTHPSNYSFCINIVLFLSNTLSCTSYHPTSASGTNEGEDTFGSGNFGGTVSYSTKSVISDSSATSAITTSNDNNTVTTMGISIRDEFFNDLSISSILDIILQRLLRYHRLELFEWSENPEQFYLSQEDLSESESLRISSEQLFLGILEKNPGLVCSKIVNYLQNIELQNIQLLLPYSSDTNTSTVSNSSSLQSTSTYSSSSYEVDDAVMFWNSVYLCTGLSASTLSQGMNASQWLASSIGPLLTEILSKATSRSLLGSLSTGQQILTTRLFWLLSCWMYYFDSDLIPQILHLINLAFDDSRYIDEVCILTAMETLQSILKCTNFKPPEHVSYLLPILNSVWTVMTNKLSENESRSTAVQTISMMIDFISCEYLLPVLDSMLSQLNEIWLDCEDSSPLRISLLDVVTRLIRCSGAHSVSIHSLAISFLSETLTGTLASAHLARECVSLWLALIRNCPDIAYTQAINDLFKSKYQFLVFDEQLAENYEDMKDIMLIAEAYAVAGKITFLTSCSSELQLNYQHILCKSPPRYVPYIIRPLDALLTICPVETIQYLIESGLLFSIARACASAIPQVNDYLRDYEEADVALISYLSVLARVLLHSQHMYQHIACMVGNSIAYKISSGLTVGVDFEYASISAPTSAEITEVLTHGWLRLLVEKFDSVGYSSNGMLKRRLWCFALLSLYPSSEPFLLDLFPEVVNIVIDAMIEEKGDELEIVPISADPSTTVSNGMSHTVLDARTKIQNNLRKKYAKLLNTILICDEDLSSWADYDDNNGADEESTILKRSIEPIIVSFTPYFYNDTLTTNILMDIAKDKVMRMYQIYGDSLMTQLKDLTGDWLSILTEN